MATSRTVIEGESTESAFLDGRVAQSRVTWSTPVQVVNRARPHSRIVWVNPAASHQAEPGSGAPEHAGNPNGVRRDLATRDVTLASLRLLSFSGYLITES